MAKSKVIPINGQTQEQTQQQEQEYQFSPLGEAVLDALDLGASTTAEIADAVGEPICIVFKMLEHLAEHGLVKREHKPEPKLKGRARR
jgi:predicted transcriptional regulator